MENFSTIRVLLLCSLFLMCTASESVANSHLTLLRLRSRLSKINHIAQLAIMKLDNYQNVTKLEEPFKRRTVQANMAEIGLQKIRSLEILRDEAASKNPGKNATSCYNAAVHSLTNIFRETVKEANPCVKTYSGELQHIYDNVNQAVQALQNQFLESNIYNLNCSTDTDCITSKIEVLERNLNTSMANGRNIVTNGPAAFSDATKHLKDCYASSIEHLRVRAKPVHQQAVDCIAKL